MSKAICACAILLIQIGRTEKLMRAETGGDEKQVIDLEWPYASNQQASVRYFRQKNVRFTRFHGTMETTYQNLHKEGIGVEIKHASIILEEEEAILWEQQILRCHSPKAL